MKATKFGSWFGCLLLAIISTGQLRAVPNTMITGSASFQGNAMAWSSGGMGTTIISFGANWMFLAGNGAYAGIQPQNTSAAFTPSLSFTGDGNVVLLMAPITNFWSFTDGSNTYSFDLAALTNGHVQSDTMSFTGTGTLFGTHFDPTPATFTMNGRTGGQDFMFQLSFVTNTANSTPDTGSTILLMSLGLVGLFVCRRRFEREPLTTHPLIR